MSAASFQNKNGYLSIAVREKATAVAADLKPREIPEDVVEWNNAKPYEAIPGLKSLPVIGTMWAMLPLVGK